MKANSGRIEKVPFPDVSVSLVACLSHRFANSVLKVGGIYHRTPCHHVPSWDGRIAVTVSK
ncbi:hypothetical protein [Sphingomonas sp. Leaf10]|uniref:hypothetical protein n=1 Tax=Sphingomonas sp. Leaf10 TaxID=1735676 RepID=UPI000A46A274|nr:hypothetical protein [Sphingomonas sp. Leaf10]